MKTRTNLMVLNHDGFSNALTDAKTGEHLRYLDHRFCKDLPRGKVKVRAELVEGEPNDHGFFLLKYSIKEGSCGPFCCPATYCYDLYEKHPRRKDSKCIGSLCREDTERVFPFLKELMEDSIVGVRLVPIDNKETK